MKRLLVVKVAFAVSLLLWLVGGFIALIGPDPGNDLTQAGTGGMILCVGLMLLPNFSSQENEKDARPDPGAGDLTGLAWVMIGFGLTLILVGLQDEIAAWWQWLIGHFGG